MKEWKKRYTKKELQKIEEFERRYKQLDLDIESLLLFIENPYLLLFENEKVGQFIPGGEVFKERMEEIMNKTMDPHSPTFFCELKSKEKELREERDKHHEENFWKVYSRPHKDRKEHISQRREEGLV